MADALTRFHEEWLGLAQPSDGLVLSVPVLVEAQILERQPVAVRHALAALAPDGRIADLGAFFADLLDLRPGDDLLAPPDDLHLYVTEGRQRLAPTWALRAATPRDVPEDAGPAVVAGAAFDALVWQLPESPDHPDGLPLDKPETLTGEWRYPPGAKLDRLLRACRVPIGLLTNGRVIRLVYAPHGQSTGWLEFRLADLLTPGGAPLLDAFIALLHGHRWYGVDDAHTLPALLAQSRTRQANVTNALADQVFDALTALLDGFDRANDRDPNRPLDAALAAEDANVYAGLLTVLLRLVFLLYAEEHSLLPVEHPLYARHLSVLGLYDQLVADHGQHPDAMDRRFGAWARLLATFRAVYFGAAWAGDAPLHMPPRQGDLFDPDRFPWLEGRLAGAATLDATQNAHVRVPALDDGTVLTVLDRLIIVERQRLSYKALDVEQIGSVYERLMGYSVLRMPAPALCLRPSRFWITGEELIDVPPGRRAAWLQEEAGIGRAPASKLADALKPVRDAAAALDVLAAATGARDRAPAGRLVLQPGPERRRTSSHYTPRSLSAPIVARTLEPLIACMGPAPSAAQLLELKICDPAMGSGAFLVEACRHLADHVVAAWTRDGTAERLAARVPDLATHARRLVAQRCLYGVDKNPFAVELARMSLWLVTLARDLPFTFVDHALRHGDSLVGLSLDQIRAFHWAPTAQQDLFADAIRQTLDDTIDLRQQILDLADAADTRAKARLLDDATTFTRRARDLADLCLGAFFSEAKPAAREKERLRRLALARAWLGDDDADAAAEVRRLAAEFRSEIPAFHWMLELPEVFYAERPDPLAGGEAGVAWMDAFVGNPPYMGGTFIKGSESP
ncbi:MAG: N-6 DNA methylase, partial [Myxococcales bacterium]|nr:N-6 DNA methylase [Myxococcales bacterium]